MKTRIKTIFCILLLHGMLGAEAQTIRDSVKIYAQPRPGDPAAMIDMAVHRVPDSPPSVSADQARLNDEELVIGTVIGDRIMAYPIRYMAMVEVVNDRVDDVPIAATWCPVSGTGAIFIRKSGETELTFDFGAGLKEDNLLIVDRETGSVWSQLQKQAISGPHSGEDMPLWPSMQTTWKAWRSRYPQTSVMVFPGHGGYAYYYHDFRSVETRRGGHDISDLGLGLDMGGGERWFFPFHSLAQRAAPLEHDTGHGRISIYYDPDALTAWAEDADGVILPGMLAYEKAWLAFFPDSHILQYRL